MSSFSPWHSGHNTRPRATATRTSVGAEVGVNLPAHRLDSKDCTTGRMVPIRRSKWLMAWYKCTCGGTWKRAELGVRSRYGVHRCRAVLYLHLYQ